MRDWPFEGLTPGKYGAIYCDPPWRYEVWAEGSTRNASNHYDLMENSDIAALPVLQLAADDCAVLCSSLTKPDIAVFHGITNV